MTAANEVRRSVMNMAWAAKRAEPVRTFSSCLKGAWAYEKRAAAKAAKFFAKAKPINGGRMIQMSPSIIQCPSWAASSRERYAGRAHWNAGRTARMGVN